MNKLKIKAFCKNPKNYLALIMFALGWFIILGFSGSIFSGYHLTDDHELIRINNDFVSGETFLNVEKKWIVNDFEIRFRPFYYLYRVLETKIFGTNIFVWSVNNFIMAVLTAYLFFISFRYLKFSFWASFFAVCLLLLGDQANIWWRLGPNETIGIFLLSLALFFVIKKAISSENKYLYGSLYLLFAILMSLSKESFVLFIPALFFLQVFITKELKNITWRGSFMESIWNGVILFVVMILELLFIFFRVGTNKIGYAGVDKLDPIRYFKTGFVLAEANFIGLLLFMMIALLIFIIIKNSSKNNLKYEFFKLVNEVLPYVILTILILIPQIILYAKSGVTARYIVPGILGLIFPFLFLFKKINETGIKFKAIRIFLSGVIILVCISSAYVSFYGAYEFGREGRETSKLFNVIRRNELKGKPYLIVSDPQMYMEWFASFGYYITYELKADNAYIYPVSKGDGIANAGNFIKEAYNNHVYKDISDMNSIKSIVIFPALEKTFSRNYNFNKEDYSREVVADFVVYSKK